MRSVALMLSALRWAIATNISNRQLLAQVMVNRFIGLFILMESWLNDLVKSECN